MAIYSKSNLKKYSNNFKKKIGIILTSVFSVLLINLLFNILPFVNKFFLGVFGLCSYALFIAGIILGAFMIANKRVSLNNKTIYFYIGLLFIILSIFHLATTKDFVDVSYGEYLSTCYNYMYSAGGVIMGIFVYPINYLTHYVGAIILYVISLIIVATLLIDQYILSKQYNVVSTETTEDVQDEEESYDEDQEDEYIPQKPSAVNDDIFISDEESEEKQNARSILGLGHKYDEELKTPEETLVKNDHFYNEIKQNSGRPNFIYHGDDNEDDQESEIITKKEKRTINREADDKKKRASEFLNATMGKYKPLDKKEDIIDTNKDLYDESLNLETYENHKEQFSEINNKVDNTFNNLMTHKDDIEFEPIVIKPKKEFYVQADITSIKKDKPIEDNIEHKVRYPKSPTYIAPTTDLLKYYEVKQDENEDEEQALKSRMLESTLESFKIPAKVTSIAKGAAFTRYELQMPVGIPVKRVLGYSDDIAMSLESNGGIRMEIPIPGKNAFGVEVPNKSVSTVSLRDVLESRNFQNSSSPLTYALGQDISADCRVGKLDKAPHLLVAGSTGSGKSVCLNSMLISWMFKASPDDLRLILIDPKQVEFMPYNGIPHLLIPHVITNTEQALCALSWCIDEMERRYTLFSKFSVRDITEYNATEEVKSRYAEHMPYIVVVVDEMADLMSQAKKDFEEKINRLAAKARAAGIHLVIATQRPSVDVITGTIKNNLPSRIAFAVTSSADSKTILGEGGAENLLGKGDMLYFPMGNSSTDRIQGSFVSNGEIKAVLDFVKENNDAIFDSEIEDKMFNRDNNEGGFVAESPTSEVFDPLLKDALRNFITTKNASVSKLQRIFNIGFNRAGRIVDQMEAAGFISAKDSKNNRVIFCTQQEFEERFGEDL